MLVWLVVSLHKPFVLAKFYCCVCVCVCVCVCACVCARARGETLWKKTERGQSQCRGIGCGFITYQDQVEKKAKSGNLNN